MYSTIFQLNTIFIPSRSGIISIKKLKIIMKEVAKITPQGFRPISVYHSIKMHLILSDVPFCHITIPYNPTYDISQSNHHPLLQSYVTNYPQSYLPLPSWLLILISQRKISSQPFTENEAQLTSRCLSVKALRYSLKTQDFYSHSHTNNYTPIHNFYCSYTRRLWVSNIHKVCTEAKYEFKEERRRWRRVNEWLIPQENHTW